MSDYSSENIREIYERHFVTVYRVCFMYLRNVHDTEDAVHNTFMKLIEKQKCFESTEHEKAWLITVASNYCKNFLHTAWYRKTVPLDQLTGAIQDETDVETITVLLELPIKYRQVLYLHYYEGYSTEEIANLLHIKPATVRTQLKRGRELLKTKLIGDMKHEESFQRV